MDLSAKVFLTSIALMLFLYFVGNLDFDSDIFMFIALAGYFLLPCIAFVSALSVMSSPRSTTS